MGCRTFPWRKPGRERLSESLGDTQSSAKGFLTYRECTQAVVKSEQSLRKHSYPSDGKCYWSSGSALSEGYTAVSARDKA